MIPLTSQIEIGLTSAEVARRVTGGQINRTPNEGWRPYAAIIARNTITLFNMLVVPAAAALFLLADYRGAWAVSAMAVANSLIGLMHEIRAKRHLDRLSLLGEIRVRVRRDKTEQMIPSGEVVLDDVLLLSAGDTVVADGTLVLAKYLELDEALLSGESGPVARTVGEPVRSGSVCVAGEGVYRAERVGGDAFVQRIADAARKYRHSPGPTQRTLERLVKWLTAIAVVLSLGYVALYYTRGFPVTDLVQMVAATITSLVPQGLVLLATLVFVLAATRLSHRGAMVQRLAAVEGLGAVDVLCTDKTGTLTTGRLTFDHFVSFSLPEVEVRKWLGVFATGSIDRRNKSIEALREALEAETPAAEILDQLPFKSQNRCSAVVARVNSEKRLLVLGSFEVLSLRFPENERIAIEAAWRERLPTGLRLIVFADGVAPSDPFNGELPSGQLRPLALVALRDELRPGVSDVLTALADQGIRFKVISGDNPETVRATVSSLGAAFTGESIVTGDEWMAAVDRTGVVERCNVFGRVSPEQKLAMVESLQLAGRNVGMIGDGVNDILSIKRADFGVAMGAGSPATKAVAAIILETNDFSVLPDVLGEGRRVVQNVRRASKLFLLKNAYTVVLILVAVGICGLPFPYLPQQVTLLNALTIGGPAVIILAGRSSTTRAIGPGFFADVGRFVLVAGGATCLVGLVVYLGSSIVFHHDIEMSRTLLLTTLIFAGIGNAVVVSRGDWWLFAWGVAAISALAIVMAVPTVAYFFALSPLSPANWIVVVLAAGIAVISTIVFSGSDHLVNGNRSRAAGGPMHGGSPAFVLPSPPG